MKWGNLFDLNRHVHDLDSPMWPITKLNIDTSIMPYPKQVHSTLSITPSIHSTRRTVANGADSVLAVAGAARVHGRPAAALDRLGCHACQRHGNALGADHYLYASPAHRYVPH